MSEQNHPLLLERKACLLQAEQIQRSAKKAGRDTTAEEDAKISELLGRAEQCKEDWSNELQPTQTRQPPLNHGGFGGGGTSRRGGTCFRDVQSGELVRTLAPGDSLAGDVAGDDYAIGRYLTARLTGQDTTAFAGAITTTDVEGGGSLLTPTLSRRWVDLARANSVCIKAGAETLPMNSPEVQIARVSADPTSYWRAEGTSVTASSVTFDRVTLRAKTLACIVPVTLEMLEDVQNLPQMIESVMAAAMGAKLDDACLSGTGAGSEPQGIYAYSTVNSVTSVGTPNNYAEVSEAVGEILTDNYPDDVSQLAWVMDPRDAETYDQLVDTLGQPLRPTPWVEKLRRFHTTSIDETLGGSGNESWMVVGDFRQMVIGMRTSGVMLRIIDAGSVTDGDSVSHNAVDELKFFIVAHMRADMALLRPTWFCKLTGITA